MPAPSSRDIFFVDSKALSPALNAWSFRVLLACFAIELFCDIILSLASFVVLCVVSKNSVTDGLSFANVSIVLSLS